MQFRALFNALTVSSCTCECLLRNLYKDILVLEKMHKQAFKVVNWKLLPTGFQCGDVFPTETEYWVEGGV